MTAVRSAPKPGPTLPTVAPALTFDVETITPDIAEAWLGRNTRNRNVKQRKVAQFKRAMKLGEWIVTGEAVKFAFDGRLLDGQNRLTAVVESGVTIRSLVVRGLPSEAQDVMDTGAARTAADALAIHGHANANVLGAAVRQLVLWKTGRFEVGVGENVPVSHSEILDFAAGNHLLAAVAVRAATVAKNVDSPAGCTVAAYYLLAEIDAEAAEVLLPHQRRPVPNTWQPRPRVAGAVAKDSRRPHVRVPVGVHLSVHPHLERVARRQDDDRPPPVQPQRWLRALP